jgi:hypothetical protein
MFVKRLKLYKMTENDKNKLYENMYKSNGFYKTLLFLNEKNR